MNDKKRFTLRLSVLLYDEIEKESKKRAISKNALIIQILWDYFFDNEQI